MDVKEESFKVCGLCSQLVDESVQLDPVFRAFLVSFLELANEALPSKVCTDCYQQSFDCKKFKDRCERAIRKLSNTKLSDSMILGRSAVDKKTIETISRKMPPPKPRPAATIPGYINKDLIIPEGSRRSANLPSSLTITPTGPIRNGGDLNSHKPKPNSFNKPNSKPKPASKKSSGTPRDLLGLGLDPNQAILDTPRRSRRSDFEISVIEVDPIATPPAPSSRNSRRKSFMSRVSRAGGVDGGPGPKITIPFVEKSLAEQARKNGGTVDYNRKRKGGALLTPSSQSKRASPPAKKARTSGPASRTGGREIVSDTDPLSTSRRKPNKEASVSSFGRQRTPKRSYAYDEDIDIDPLDTAALAQNDVGSSPSPKSKRKSGPASASKGSAKNDKKGKKGGGGAQQGYYYVGDEGEAIQAPDPEPEEDDQEEIFPSIGPYQCEICQEITDTKQEFVNHIKRFHRNVVDEEVLRSLEQDLKKSKKAAAAKAVGKTASGKEGKPGKAGPAARKKPAAPAPTAKKSRPSPAARKPATPKSKPKSRAAPKSRARPAPKARASPAAAAAESNNLSTAAEVAPAYVSNGDADGMKTTQKVNGDSGIKHWKKDAINSAAQTLEEAVSLAVSGIDMAVSDGAVESDPIGNVPTSNDEQHVVQEEQQQFFEEPQQMVMTSNEESNVASVGVMEEAPPAAMEAVEGNAAVMETVVAEPEMEAAVEEQQQHQEQHQEIYHQIEEAPQVQPDPEHSAVAAAFTSAETVTNISTSWSESTMVQTYEPASTTVDQMTAGVAASDGIQQQPHLMNSGMSPLDHHHQTAQMQGLGLPPSNDEVIYY